MKQTKPAGLGWRGIRRLSRCPTDVTTPTWREDERTVTGGCSWGLAQRMSAFQQGVGAKVSIAQYVLLGALIAPMGQADDEGWDWVSQVQGEAARSLIARLSAQEPEPRSVKWSALVEANDGWGATAFLRIWVPWTGATRASHVRLVGATLQSQLQKLRKEDSRLDLGAALSKLSLSEAHLVSCPLLDKVARRLESMKIPALPDSGLTLHSPGYSVSVVPAFKSERKYVIDEDEGALAKWCVEVLRTAQSCVSGRGHR
jgi:hypothetical protein